VKRVVPDESGGVSVGFVGDPAAASHKSVLSSRFPVLRKAGKIRMIIAGSRAKTEN